MFCKLCDGSLLTTVLPATLSVQCMQGTEELLSMYVIIWKADQVNLARKHTKVFQI